LKYAACTCLHGLLPNLHGKLCGTHQTH
jgi:hypothetical protein